MSDPFYQCKLCKKYSKGKEVHKKHKLSCYVPSVPRRRKVMAKKSSKISDPVGSTISRTTPVKMIKNSASSVAQKNIEIPIEDQETDHCSSSNSVFEASGDFKEEDDALSIRITSVVGNGGVTAPVVVKKEDVWRREKATIPVLLEKIKVEPPATNTIRPGPASYKRAVWMEIEAQRRLQIKLEPITNSICRFIFKSSPVKGAEEMDPMSHTPVPRSCMDHSERNSHKQLSLQSRVENVLRAKAKDIIEEGPIASENYIKAGPVEDAINEHPEKTSAQVEGKKSEAIIFLQTWEFFDKDGKEKADLSPACSYVQALNASGMRRKRKRTDSIPDDKSCPVLPPPQPTDPGDKRGEKPMELPSHITLLKGDDLNAKPVYQCNFCQNKLYNEAQFKPHKLCDPNFIESIPQPEDESKKYCKCRNGYVGAYKVPMIQCSKCEEWYHGICIGLGEKINEIPEHEPWNCSDCVLAAHQGQKNPTEKTKDSLNYLLPRN